MQRLEFRHSAHTVTTIRAGRRADVLEIVRHTATAQKKSAHGRLAGHGELELVIDDVEGLVLALVDVRRRTAAAGT